MDKDLKDQIKKAISELLPDSVDQRIKDDIFKIVCKIMQTLEGESLMGSLLALSLLEAAYQSTVMDVAKEHFGSNSNSFEKFMHAMSSETVH